METRKSIEEKLRRIHSMSMEIEKIKMQVGGSIFMDLPNTDIKAVSSLFADLDCLAHGNIDQIDEFIEQFMSDHVGPDVPEGDTVPSTE